VIHGKLGPSWSRAVHNHAHISAKEAAYLVAFRTAVMVFNCLGAGTYCALKRKFPTNTVRLAAPGIALLSVMPDVVAYFVDLDGDGLHNASDHEQLLPMWSVCFLAFALGGTHFLCSPAADGSRLKAVTMAATGHMHGVTKLLYRLSAGDEFKAADWEKMKQSATVTFGMAFGAVLGAMAMHVNPFGVDADSDDWLLVPVAITLLVGLVAHDACIEPPGGWPSAQDASLREPLTVGVTSK